MKKIITLLFVALLVGCSSSIVGILSGGISIRASSRSAVPIIKFAVGTEINSITGCAAMALLCQARPVSRIKAKNRIIN